MSRVLIGRVSRAWRDMKIKTGNKNRRPLRRIAIAAFLLFVVVVLVNWRFPCAMLAYTTAKAAPQFAWTYGPPGLQSFAAKELATRIVPGMTFEEVYAVIGKGAKDGSQLKGRKLQKNETISFNVRSSYNNGLDVTFTNGVVAAVSYYD